jgi:hypothetical protein
MIGPVGRANARRPYAIFTSSCVGSFSNGQRQCQEAEPKIHSQGEGYSTRSGRRFRRFPAAEWPLCFGPRRPEETSLPLPGNSPRRMAMQCPHSLTAEQRWKAIRYLLYRSHCPERGRRVKGSEKGRPPSSQPRYVGPGRCQGAGGRGRSSGCGTPAGTS